MSESENKSGATFQEAEKLKFMIPMLHIAICLKTDSFVRVNLRISKARCRRFVIRKKLTLLFLCVCNKSSRDLIDWWNSNVNDSSSCAIVRLSQRLLKCEKKKNFIALHKTHTYVERMWRVNLLVYLIMAIIGSFSWFNDHFWWAFLSLRTLFRISLIRRFMIENCCFLFLTNWHGSMMIMTCQHFIVERSRDDNDYVGDAHTNECHAAY